MLEVLNVLNAHLEQLGLNYEFGQYSKTPPDYPYWVGDYTESDGMTEDGKEIPVIILSGFTRGKFIDLETEKEAIKEHFKMGVSEVVQTDSGKKVSVNIWFLDSMNIPNTENEMDMKRCEIHLQTKIWKGYE